MNSTQLPFSQQLRRYRTFLGRPLRDVADHLQVDVSLVSKWERGERTPNRIEVIALSRFLNADSKSLLVAWLRDKVVEEMQDDEFALEALKAAEAHVKSHEKSE